MDKARKSRFLIRDDGTIFDSVTTLTWKAKDSQLDLEKEVSWDEAESYRIDMNKNKFADHDDWRMPTIHEAQSLYDKDKLNKDVKGADIHLDSVFPPGPANCTWTTDVRGGEAQILFYINGCGYWYDKNDQTISHGVRLVRRD